MQSKLLTNTGDFSFSIGKKKLIVFSCVINPVFMDATYGFAQMLGNPVPIGILFRGLIWLYSIGLLLTDILNRKSNHWLFVIFLIYPLFIIIWILRDSEGFSLGREIIYALKITYGFALIQIFGHFQLSKPDLIRALMIHGIIVSCFFVFSLTTGIGLATYGEYAFGISSFFQVPNDIGITLLCILIFHLLLNPLMLNKWRYIIVAILISLSLISIGSTTGIFGTIFILSSFLFWKLIKYKNSYAWNYLLKWMAICFLILLIVLSVYKTVQIIRTNNYLSNKYEVLLTDGPRANLRIEALQVFTQHSFWDNWLGYGISSFNYGFAYEMRPYLRSREEEVDYKTVEMDALDLLGMGYLIGGFILFIYGFFLCRILYYCRYKNSIEYKAYLTTYVLLILHGLLAGHVLLSPTTQLILAVIISSCFDLFIKKFSISINNSEN